MGCSKIISFLLQPILTVFVVMTALFLPLEQWIARMFPSASFPATIPTRDKSL